MSRFFSIPFALGLIILLRCATPTSVADTESGSEITNGFAALVLDHQGVPLADAEVACRPHDYFAGSTLEQVITRTDTQGHFRVSLQAGDTVSIEVREDTLHAAFIPRFIVGHAGLDTITTQRTGSITLVNSDGPQELVRVLGTNITAAVSGDMADGLVIPSLAPGAYSLLVGTDTPQRIDSIPVASRAETELLGNNGSYQALPPRGFSDDSLAVTVFLNNQGIAQNLWDSIIQSTGYDNRMRKLDLSGYDLGTLHPSIGTLDFLRTLHLNSTGLTALPPEMASIRNLQHLQIQYNALDSLPSWIGEYASLLTLWCDSCGLTDLPSSLSQTRLRNLSATRNNFTRLPPVVYACRDLIKLNMCNNDIGTLDTALAALTSLQRIEFNNNTLQTIPDVFGAMPELTRFSFNNNSITELPPSLFSCTRMRFFSIENNHLTHIDEGIGNFTACTRLSLHFNELISLPQSITNLNNLELLKIGRNRLCSVSAPVNTWLSGILGPDWQTETNQRGCQ